MRATGIVRRIDDLGRVVIPKEIRRSMNIKEGDPLEIYTTKEGGICFQKYNIDYAKELESLRDRITECSEDWEFTMTINNLFKQIAEHIEEYENRD